ncbi:hypothetical protein AAZX31_14G099800 [Glycine max]
MMATSEHFHYFKTSLLLPILMFPLVQPLSFNITNFSDTESASLVEYAGVAKTENGTVVLNPLINAAMSDFSTRFSFTIDAPNKTMYADGFAFYVAPLTFAYQDPPNSGGLRLGLYDDNKPQNSFIAVEFDTFVNEFDPSGQHNFDIESNIGNMGHALITYNASAKLLSVSWFFEGTSSGFTPNTSLSHQIDLAETLPEWVAVGFSGSTGSYKEKNVIHSWEFSSSLELNSTHPEVNIESDITKCKFQVKVVVVAVTCSIISVALVLSVSWFIIKKRRTKDGFGNLDHMPRRFAYKELVAATNGFADDRRLGEGGYGRVYRGFLSDSVRVVAVKRIFSDVEDSEKIFSNEVKIISRLMHRNLVQFMGWCHEQGELLLVFEYMVNGSLDTHLFGSRRTLTWGVRYKIALGVVRALQYLHEDAVQCVLHRDIKSGNVLLDTDFNTKVSDFGMAKLVDPRLRTQKTKLVGTYGYLAPEYVKEGRASKESDMYGFGVLALEIACGMRTYQDRENNHVPLTNWVWKQYEVGNVLNAADKGLNDDYDVNEMTCLLTVGLWCTLHDHKKRPKAEQVINVLKQGAPLSNLFTDMRA